MRNKNGMPGRTHKKRLTQDEQRLSDEMLMLLSNVLVDASDCICIADPGGLYYLYQPGERREVRLFP